MLLVTVRDCSDTDDQMIDWWSWHWYCGIKDPVNHAGETTTSTVEYSISPTSALLTMDPLWVRQHTLHKSLAVLQLVYHYCWTPTIARSRSDLAGTFHVLQSWLAMLLTVYNFSIYRHHPHVRSEWLMTDVHTKQYQEQWATEITLYIIACIVYRAQCDSVSLACWNIIRPVQNNSSPLTSDCYSHGQLPLILFVVKLSVHLNLEV